VTGPLTRSRFSFAPGVAEKLVQDLLQVNVGNKTYAVRGDYVEPVQLQVVCEALCRHLPPNVSVTTLDHLRSFGNVNEALANFYKKCLKETTRATHVWGGRLRKWFERTLITPEGVRDAVRQGPTKTGGLPNRAVQKLEELHLIRGEERSGRGRWYELIHDTFIRPIQEVNRIADRRMHVFQGIVASVGVVALVAVCGWSIHAWKQAKERELRYKGAVADGYQSLRDQRYQDAVKQLEQALRIHPENRDAHLLVAFSHSMLPDHDDQAVSHYHKALEIKPEVRLYIVVSEIYARKAESAEAGDADVFFHKAEAEVNEAAKRYPESPEPDVGRGDIEVGREQKREGGKYSDAEKYYLEAIKKDSKSQDACRGLAYVHLNRGEVDKAIQDARKAVKLAPDLAAPHGTLGEAYFWKENYYEAAAELGRAIGLNSQDYGSHNRLGDVYYMKENYELAKIEYEQALKLAESGNDSISMAVASTNLGYMALKQHKWDLADGHFNKALHWNPKSDYVHFCRGLLLFTPKEPQKAKADWNKALALCKGTSPLKRMARAIYEVALGMPESVEDMSSIIGEHPPIGMMDSALDDANLLVAFKINLADSQKIRDMLVKAIEETRNQPAQEE
jgi:Tfp pilus assembly protein PilF